VTHLIIRPLGFQKQDITNSIYSRGVDKGAVAKVGSLQISWLSGK
jgi:hypothetical protein